MMTLAEFMETIVRPMPIPQRSVPALLTMLAPTPLWFWEDGSPRGRGRVIRIKLPRDYMVSSTP
jgi:hypothetical protein